MNTVWDRWADPLDKMIYYIDGYEAYRQIAFQYRRYMLNDDEIPNPYPEGDLRNRIWRFGWEDAYDSHGVEDLNYD